MQHPVNLDDRLDEGIINLYVALNYMLSCDVGKQNELDGISLREDKLGMQLYSGWIFSLNEQLSSNQKNWKEVYISK